MEHHASLTRDPVVLTGTSQWTDMIDRAGGSMFSRMSQDIQLMLIWKQF